MSKAEKKGDRLTLIFVGVLLLGAVLMGWQEVLEKEVLAKHSVAPDFALERPDGSTVDLASLRGQVVVVNFWATWCPPCREELPVLISTVKHYEAQGVTLIAINTDDLDEQREMVTSFLSAFPELIPYVALGRPEVGERYRVKALPSLYVIDRQGKISSSYEGQASEEQLHRWVAAALKE